jgi:hypothetical protein
MGTYCAHCSERIVKTKEDDYRDWRHKETGSMFCKKVRGKRTTIAEPRDTSQEVRTT